MRKNNDALSPNSKLRQGSPTIAGMYFVCVINKQTNEYEWKEAYLDPGNPDPIWEQAICWSYT